MDIQIMAGSVSTVVFIVSSFLMVYKAYTTSDLESYSLGNLIFNNLGNLIHWIYISSLPLGPIWFLHAYYTLITALMLLWYFRFRRVQSDKIIAKSRNSFLSKIRQFSGLAGRDKDVKSTILEIRNINLQSNPIIECLCGCLSSLLGKIKNKEILQGSTYIRLTQFHKEELQQII